MTVVDRRWFVDAAGSPVAVAEGVDADAARELILGTLTGLAS
jgi:hypothetical protein